MKSACFQNVYLKSSSVVANKKEKEGPYGAYFDYSYSDLYCDEKSWEKAEIAMFKKSIDLCLKKANMHIKDIDLILGGDLNNQIIVGSYALKEVDVAWAGIFSACATSVEGLLLASSLIESGNYDDIMVSVSSHNATAEKQFRYPLEYGRIVEDFTTSTVSIASSAILSNEKSDIRIINGTFGAVKESYNKNSMDMGRAMATSCYDTLINHLNDFHIDVTYYDLILTGDLSRLGKQLFLDLLKSSNIKVDTKFLDAGEMIYGLKNTDHNSGGSGVGCLPGIFYSYILKLMREKKLKRVLLLGSGALLNPIMCAQKESIPVISHAISMEVVE